MDSWRGLAGITATDFGPLPQTLEPVRLSMALPWRAAPVLDPGTMPALKAIFANLLHSPASVLVPDPAVVPRG